MREKTKLNQWKNNQAVIEWFKDIKNKKQLRFIQFDTIKEDLLEESLDFASDYVEISDEDREIIIQANKTLLSDAKLPWVKKGDSNFAVGMGSFDGSKTCELVGLFLLSKLQNQPGIVQG